MELNRRTLLRRAGVAGAVGLAGCSGGGDPAPSRTDTATDTGTPTESPTATLTPACNDSTYRDTIGEFSFEYGVKSENEGKRYDGRLRIYHVRRPPCSFGDRTPTDGGDCGERTEELLADREYTVSPDLTYDIVDASVTTDVDSYRIEWEANGGKDVSRGVEWAARSLVDTSRYDFFVCNPGARRFGFVVAGRSTLIVRASDQYGGE